MKSRERVIRAIDMARPDRVPIIHSTLAGAWAIYGDRLRELYLRYPSDVLYLGETGRGEFSGKAGVTSTDAWGAVWTSATDGYKGQVAEALLKTWEDLEKLHAPSPVVDAGELAQAREAIRLNRGEKYILVDGDTLWQRMFYLRGFAPMLEDLLVEPERAAALRELILEFMLRRIEAWLELEVDGFEVRDDWGTQKSLMINPRLWREFFKPAYRQIGDLIHSAGKHFWFHCDGHIWDILPDFIGIGVDVLNAEVFIMGLEEVGSHYGGKLCFLVDMEKQSLFPFGSPQEVRQAVGWLVKAFGGFRGGLMGRGQAAPDVPLENLEAMFRAFAEIGTYS